MKKTFLKINKRFSIGVDTYNWILQDRERGVNRQDSYFARPEKIAREIAWRFEKDAIAKGELDTDKYLCSNTPIHALTSNLLEDIGQIVRAKLETLKKELETKEGQ